MPENAYRRGHLWSHLAASSTEPYSLTRLRRLHPDWRECRAGCGWIVDPAADPSSTPIHPTCEEPPR